MRRSRSERRTGARRDDSSRWRTWAAGRARDGVVPDAPGPHPLIVFSHGFGGSSRGYVGLSSYWASHGYVVIAPSHADSVQLRKEGKAGRQMDDVLKAFGSDPSLRINRVADIKCQR